jgi:hypothetical protein
MRPVRAACAAIAVGVALSAGSVRAQNDWQFPDPYFGILEIEKSHTPAADRRSRAEIAPAPRPPRPVPQRSRQRWFRPRPRAMSGSGGA